MRRAWNLGIALSLATAMLGSLESGCGGKAAACDPALAQQSQLLASTCLPKPLTTDARGTPECRVFVPERAGSTFCSCTDPGYRPTTFTYSELASNSTSIDACTEPSAEPCICELLPLQGQSLHDCLTMTEVEWQRQIYPTDGWCYIDPAQGIGTPAAVEHCSMYDNASRRVLRTLGNTETQAFLACVDNP